MGKLLTILGADEKVQETLPADLFQAEKVIVGLQEIYSKAPDSPKKNQLAIAISESVRIMMARLNPYLVKEEVEEKTEEEDKKLPDEEKPTPRVRREQPKPPMPPEIPETPKDKPEDKPEPKGEEPKPKKEKPKQQPPAPPQPPTPSPHKRVEDEVMSCDEIKAAINGLTLLAKMGDTEAKEIVKTLKNKYKTQNCK
jgi:outer membrane biosynthesis protein TonB